MLFNKDNSSQLGLVIIAAGNSSRLGKAKQLVQYGEQTLLGRTIEQAEQLAEHCICVLGFDAEKMQRAITAKKTKLVINTQWAVGMGTSIACGIQQLPANCAAVLILLCDQWAIELADLKTLKSTWQKSPDKIIASEYFEPKLQQTVLGAPAIFPRQFFPQLMPLKETGARKILNQNNDQLIAVPIDHAALDLDTPQDLNNFYSQIKTKPVQQEG
jgi:molybdenum cofactor cytidylyltransferase